MAEAAAELAVPVVPIDLQKVALQAEQLKQEVTPDAQVVLVGNSALDIVTGWQGAGTFLLQKLVVVQDDRSRENRELWASNITSESPLILVDDVAVSGNTLQTARQAVRGTVVGALVGLAWDSKRLRRAVDGPLYQVIRYRQAGGGRPPMNSLSTLANNPELCAAYAEQRFGAAWALDEVMKAYKEGDNND